MVVVVVVVVLVVVVVVVMVVVVVVVVMVIVVVVDKRKDTTFTITTTPMCGVAMKQTSLSNRTMAVTKVEGFTFPVNSAFLANLSFFMNDPAHFHLPGEFNPGRFIAPDGR